MLTSLLPENNDPVEPIRLIESWTGMEMSSCGYNIYNNNIYNNTPVGINFLLLPFLKVRINMLKCWQLQIKMLHQKKNPHDIKLLISN